MYWRACWNVAASRGYECGLSGPSGTTIAGAAPARQERMEKPKRTESSWLGVTGIDPDHVLDHLAGGHELGRVGVEPPAAEDDVAAGVAVGVTVRVEVEPLGRGGGVSEEAPAALGVVRVDAAIAAARPRRRRGLAPAVEGVDLGGLEQAVVGVAGGEAPVRAIVETAGDVGMPHVVGGRLRGVGRHPRQVGVVGHVAGPPDAGGGRDAQHRVDGPLADGRCRRCRPRLLPMLSPHCGIVSIDPDESRRNMMLEGPTGSVKNCSSPVVGPRVVLASEPVAFEAVGRRSRPPAAGGRRRRGAPAGRGRGCDFEGSWPFLLESEPDAELDLELPPARRGPVAAHLAVDDDLVRVATQALGADAPVGGARFGGTRRPAGERAHLDDVHAVVVPGRGDGPVVEVGVQRGDLGDGRSQELELAEQELAPGVGAGDQLLVLSARRWLPRARARRSGSSPLRWR